MSRFSVYDPSRSKENERLSRRYVSPSVRLSYRVCRSIANLAAKGFRSNLPAKRRNRIELTNRMIELPFDRIEIRELKLYGRKGSVDRRWRDKKKERKKKCKWGQQTGAPIVETGNVP